MSLSPHNPFSIQAKLLRFEERWAVLYHESLGEFKWPIKNLPDDVKIEDIITIKIASPKDEKEEKYEHMKRLLEELIN